MLIDPAKAVLPVHSAGCWTQEISLGRVDTYENRRQPFLQVVLGHQIRILISLVNYFVLIYIWFYVHTTICTNTLSCRHVSGLDMPVIAIVNQKGGTGKTTLSINLASAFADLYPTLLLDADPQGSALDWADSRSIHQMNLDVRELDPGGLLRQVRSFARNYEWIIIDGPPGIGRISADAVRAADIVLIPTKPSQFDVLAASEIVDAVQARQETADGLPRAFFVVTMARPRTRLSAQVDTALAEYGIATLSARTSERVAYPMSATEGKSVLDWRDKTAKQEIFAIRDEIMEMTK